MAAMARWPNVPAVYGWLSLDRRGRWRLRGELFGNPAAREFVSRNYARDERGCWYFQNGPQRVFVSLEYTPWVFRLGREEELRDHIGRPAGAPRQVFMDEEGSVLIETGLGIGLLDDRDLAVFSDMLADERGINPGDEVIAQRLSALIDGTAVPGKNLFLGFNNEFLPLQPIQHAQVAVRFKFEAQPREAL